MYQKSNGNGRSFGNENSQVTPQFRKKMETYEDLNIEPRPLRPHILAAATIAYGDDYYNGPRETVSLSGMVQINKWPMPGFRHQVREDGTAEFGVELISQQDVGIKGFSYFLNDKLQVLSHPNYPNTGSISQLVPGKNFPAKFIINRHGVIATAGMRLVHRNVIRIEGIVDSIPPYKKPLTPPMVGVPSLTYEGRAMPHVNVVGGINLPEAWSPADENLEPLPPIVAFFVDGVVKCTSTLVHPNYIVQASAIGEMSLQMNGATELVQLAGDHRMAAGLEMLMFNADRHQMDDSVQVQVSRMALVGHSELFEGRIMLRASFFKVSKGPLGNCDEKTYEQLHFPADLSLEVHLELVTPQGELVTFAPIELLGRISQDVPRGAVLSSQPLKNPISFVAPDGRKIADINQLSLQLGEGIFGTEAYVDAPALIETTGR